MKPKIKSEKCKESNDEKSHTGHQKQEEESKWPSIQKWLFEKMLMFFQVGFPQSKLMCIYVHRHTYTVHVSLYQTEVKGLKEC